MELSHQQSNQIETITCITFFCLQMSHLIVYTETICTDGCPCIVPAHTDPPYCPSYWDAMEETWIV